MARKTTGSTTTRSRKSKAAVPPVTVENAAEVRNEVRNEVRTNGKAASQGATMAAPVNIEEEIRRRAYELYLQRRATAGAGNGDENQDWFLAEREILSRRDPEQHSA